MKLFDKIFQGDKVIWMVVALLVIFSLLAGYSSAERFAFIWEGGNVALVLKKHVQTILIGVALMYVAYMMKYTWFSKLFQIAMIFSIPLLILTLVNGKSVNGAQRAFTINGKELFQTSEFAKVALIGYLARMLALGQEKYHDYKAVIIDLFVPIALICGLIFTENLSTAAILAAVSLMLLFVGRIKFKFLMAFVGVCIMLAGLYVVIDPKSSDKKDEGSVQVDNRIGTWGGRIKEFFVGVDLESMTDAERIEYMNNSQEIQSELAIASGGLVGKSPGKSTQRNFLQHSYSDFIYSIIVEEYGLLGGVVVMLLYLILLFRSIRIMMEIPESFGAYVAFGLASLIVVQAFAHIAVAVGLAPVTGQPLPFISKGGSSMMSTGAAIGVILSVSKKVDKIKRRRNELAAA
ncbi:MAG: FtsW/RodA/SpoVE family cell cycle protein [Bacteroidales bacterium]|nr:FtsW/RodA/SpoVE family cell cycle protein [Bacteroidales bacterium]